MIKSDAVITKRQSERGNVYYKVNIFDGSRYVFPEPEQAIGFIREKKGLEAKIKVKE